ncbi:MAG: hypothetical protein ACI8XM_001212 [Haloarculaceae archaeon]|jgi:hypothetical protein
MKWPRGISTGSIRRRFGDSGGSGIESDGSSLLPLDSEDDIQGMRIDELGSLVDDGRRAIVDLEMDRAEIVIEPQDGNPRLQSWEEVDTPWTTTRSQSPDPPIPGNNFNSILSIFEITC